MLDFVLSIVGTIFTITLLVWIFITFVPEIIKISKDYIVKNKKFVVTCLFITSAIVVFLYSQNQFIDIVSISIMFLLSVPIIALLIGALLELLKSPYSEIFGNFYYKFEGVSKIGMIYFLIGIVVYVIMMNMLN